MVRYYFYLVFIAFTFLLVPAAHSQGGFTGNMAQQYVVEGDNFMKIGDFNNAILSYTNAVNSNVGYGEALVKRAIALKLVGRVTEGRDDLDKALRLGPQFAVMYDTLTTKKMRRDSLSTLNNPYENLNLTGIPEDTSTFFSSALARLDAADFDNAINYLAGHIKKNPQDTLAITFLAIAYINDERYDSAFANIKKLGRLDKSTALPYAIYGLYNYKRGYYIDAIDNFNKAVQIDPLFSIAYFNRGLCKKRMGNERGYNDDFEKALDVDAGIANTYYNRSYYETKEGIDGAKYDLGKAVELNKKFNTSYYRTESTKKILTDYYNVFNEFTADINKNAKDPDAIATRANFLLLFGEYTPAVIDFNKAIALNPQIADYIFGRGMARLLKNDNNMGCRDLKKSVELGIDKAGQLVNTFCK